jgi:hypothetical protein
MEKITVKFNCLLIFLDQIKSSTRLKVLVKKYRTIDEVWLELIPSGNVILSAYNEIDWPILNPV